MSWDEELSYKTGEYNAMECRANPTMVSWLFRPGVNIKRSPLCGRNFEYFSEDPVLAGELAGSYIQGLQAKDVAATIKHFICNNQEFERMTTDSVVSERALREIYLRVFEIAIRKGNPLSVMSSYNQVNGEWVNSNQKICDLLRKDLGYEGVVVSDFAAIHHNKIASHNCGMMDIELAPVDIHTDELIQAVKDGRVKEETFDTYLEAVRAVVPDAGYVQGYPVIEDWPPVEPADPQMIREAVEAAKKADKILFIAGLGYCYESEGYDRKDIQLPEGQQALLDELVKLDKPIILVLSCASVLDISRWEDRVAAVLYNSLGGEAVASATVNILFGDAEPGGRLAESWPVCEEHTPAYLNFTRACQDKLNVFYGEDIYVGYRWYEKRKLPVLYPFGYGLSYTTFAIGKPSLSKSSVTPEDTLEIRVPVTNTGKRAGSQVIQLYLRHVKDSICDHPDKELKAFAKVRLNPGETKEAVLTLDRRAFEFFTPAQNQWIIEDGAYTLCIGTSVADILYEELVMMSGGDIPFIYTKMTPLAFYKVTGSYLGAPMMSEEQAEYVLKK